MCAKECVQRRHKNSCNYKRWLDLALLSFSILVLLMHVLYTIKFYGLLYQLHKVSLIPLVEMVSSWGSIPAGHSHCSMIMVRDCIYKLSHIAHYQSKATNSNISSLHTACLFQINSMVVSCNLGGILHVHAASTLYAARLEQVRGNPS